MPAQVEIRLTGPMFERDPAEIVRLYLVEAVQDVADHGANLVVHECARVFRDPTPYYWTRVTTERQHNSPDVIITDQRVIYGPWLEGTSWRNLTTRFKGYSVFRRTTNLLDRQAQGIAERTLDRFIRRFG